MDLFYDDEVEVDPLRGYCVDCHIGGDDGGPVIPRTADGFHAYLLETTAEACAGHKLVVPGDPEVSALALLLAGRCDDGRIMPPTFPLYPDELDGVKAWIAAGAEK